jgi:mannose-6-phosphate isomerase-like protein (cupin superfamily)
MQPIVENIESDGKILAVIIRAQFNPPGVHFVTPPEFSQQLAYMRHSAGKVIKPHLHNAVERTVQRTQEVLLLRRGRLRANIFDERLRWVATVDLEAGDVILLAFGGHGFEALEDIELIEVKQGPYGGEGDKTHFDAGDLAAVHK